MFTAAGHFNDVSIDLFMANCYANEYGGHAAFKILLPFSLEVEM